MKLLDEVKKGLKPKDSVIKEVDGMLKSINGSLKKKKISAKAVAGGSIAKDTNLAEDFDIDVFVKFSYSKYKEKDLSELLEKALKHLKPARLHGSRDYFQIKGKLNFEIVPVLDVKDPNKALNVTDMSPLHVLWVDKMLKKKPSLKDEIRLAKQFCKAQRCYGAESYINGFSGHVLDILVIHYGSFLGLLKASQKWKHGKLKTVVDFYDKHKGNALFNLNSSKIMNSLVVIDPVLPDRNAAAAVVDEKMIAFIKAAKSFLKKPSKRFFVMQELDAKKLAGKNKLVVLKVKPKRGTDDVVGTKLLKAFEHVKAQIIENDFELLKSDWEWNKKNDAMFYFVCKKDKLDLRKRVKGPPKSIKHHVMKFKKKHNKTFIEDKIYYAEVKRKYVDLHKLIKDLIKSDYVKQKTTKMSVD